MEEGSLGLAEDSLEELPSRLTLVVQDSVEGWVGSHLSLTPPFTQDNQLVPDQDATGIDVHKTYVERKSLLESLYDDDLHSMHKWLWYAGRKGNISPLHHQKVIHRDIILTERARLHLM